ncbi:MAG: diaminopimelate epimerase [Alphaproteobacteria bacterium]
MTDTPPAKREYRKAHGLGNDFIIFDARYEPLEISQTSARQLARRDGGFGCDQVLVLSPPKNEGTARMEVYNADGSLSAACGNGARCLGWLLLQEQAGGLAPVSLEAGNDLLACRLVPPLANPGPYGDNASGWVEVTLPAPRFAAHEIPLNSPLETQELTPQTLAEALGTNPNALPGVGAFVNLGNPHLVFEMNDRSALENYPLDKLAKICAESPLFSEGINLQLVVLEEGREGGDGQHATLRHRIWERGSGETLSSGTGAAAAAVALIRRGRIRRIGRIGREVRLIEPGGGILAVSWEVENPELGVRQRGPVTFTFNGEMNWPPAPEN